MILQKYMQVSPNGFTEDLSTIDENESDKQVDEELAALRKASKGMKNKNQRQVPLLEFWKFSCFSQKPTI